MLPVFAAIVAASTAILIFAGGMVTSHGAGLSVPDWPNTYGWFMFSFPVDKWVGGIFYEHSHRLIASTVGFLIMVLAFWLWRAEPRAWVRRLGFLALGAVITQGILGGITVLWYLPDAISIAHAGLAEIVFCLTVTIALVTSPGWRRGYSAGLPNDRVLQKIAIATTATVYLQILIGATMRHTDAGLAIPDLRRPSVLLLCLVTMQVTLGALTVLSGRQPIINSLHVVTGASVLVTTLVLTLRAHRARFDDGALGVRVPRPPHRGPDALSAHADAGARA